MCVLHFPRLQPQEAHHERALEVRFAMFATLRGPSHSLSSWTLNFLGLDHFSKQQVRTFFGPSTQEVCGPGRTSGLEVLGAEPLQPLLPAQLRGKLGQPRRRETAQMSRATLGVALFGSYPFFGW